VVGGDVRGTRQRRVHDERDAGGRRGLPVGHRVVEAGRACVSGCRRKGDRLDPVKWENAAGRMRQGLSAQPRSLLANFQTLGSFRRNCWGNGRLLSPTKGIV